MKNLTIFISVVVATVNTAPQVILTAFKAFVRVKPTITTSNLR